ncbi:uncharacterized protein PHALS_02353 [Plasmopara halstedii]|uniref:Uncharacterized protein n=1 Tax=Plasmopara halstedii TaxID=4781 RepID=A0A0P1AUR6_PLAHL|nr:uncharacterized protein PHALS_02353 [Plasmopara halstedii]CEG46026.1 hypothetical protein PHALS_02353 [Plasmopara halstedii]|eukprot:XP_024582395.1 hypothetical protein PHALS_02353 [Plasmopara halstedii]
MNNINSGRTSQSGESQYEQFDDFTTLTLATLFTSGSRGASLLHTVSGSYSSAELASPKSRYIVGSCLFLRKSVDQYLHERLRYEVSLRYYALETATHTTTASVF